MTRIEKLPRHTKAHTMWLHFSSGTSLVAATTKQPTNKKSISLVNWKRAKTEILQWNMQKILSAKTNCWQFTCDMNNLWELWWLNAMACQREGWLIFTIFLLRVWKIYYNVLLVVMRIRWRRDEMGLILKTSVVNVCP